MQFGPDAATEIIAPAGVPFAPGNDVIGFGTQVPPALLAAGFPAAIIFYNSGYSPTNTWPSVKYSFIASQSGVSGSNGAFGGIAFGIGYVANPSVSQAETVLSIGQMIMQAATTGAANPFLAYEGFNMNGVVVTALLHGSNAGPGATQNGMMLMINNSGAAEDGGTQVVGGVFGGTT